MARRVIVDPQVSRRVGLCMLSLEGLVHLLTSLHDDLANFLDLYQNQRDPEDVSLFRCRQVLLDGGIWHSFRFRVDDSTSPDHPFVRTVAHHSSPASS